MNNPLTKLPLIKSALQRHIAEAEQVTKGPWKSFVNHKPYKSVWIDKGQSYSTLELKAEDSDFIAHARTMSPAACKALLVAIEALVNAHIALPDGDDTAWGAIETICRDWPEEAL